MAHIKIRNIRTADQTMANKQHRILIVDDTPANIEFVKKYLQQHGYIVDAALNGHESITRFQENTPDVILMDVMMPEMDGYEATRRLRKLTKDRWVPIIFMSALISPEDQIKGLDAGGDDYMPKPVNLKILSAKIQAMQRIAEMQKQLQEYRLRAEEEQELARGLLERMTRSDELTDKAMRCWSCPTERLSGDIVAAHRCDGGKLYILLEDAAGHGLPAALSQLPITQIFYTMAEKGFALSTIVTAMNTTLHSLLPVDRFVTATLAILDEKNKLIEIWNGANPEALVVNDEGEKIRAFESKHTPLGVVDKNRFDASTEIFLWPEQAELLIFSDGFWMPIYSERAQFGMEGFNKGLQNPSATSYFESIKEAVNNHLGGKRGQDDISLVSVKCH